MNILEIRGLDYNFQRTSLLSDQTNIHLLMILRKSFRSLLNIVPIIFKSNNTLQGEVLALSIMTKKVIRTNNNHVLVLFWCK